jgi:glycosyltransferase involved in cell wall biosynthesis
MRLAQHWRDRGWDVSILTPRPAGSKSAERIDGVRFVRRGGRHTVFPSARRYLRQEGRGYDWVIECISTRPFFAHHVAGVRAVALYMQMAIDVWDAEFMPPVSWIGRRVAEPHWVRSMRGARVISISRSTANDLAARGITTVAIAPPGCDVRPRNSKRTLHEDPRLLFIGRLARQKRPDAAIQAFEVVRRRFPRARLDVLGDGGMRRRLERMKGPGVHLHGFVAEAAKTRFIDEADLMLIPSTREGWGIIAVEAAARGLPVVGYDVGGLRESIAAGRTGILCAPEPRAAAQSAVGLLSDHAAWQRMSAEGPLWAAQFSWERTAEAVMDALADGSSGNASRERAVEAGEPPVTRAVR